MSELEEHMERMPEQPMQDQRYRQSARTIVEQRLNLIDGDIRTLQKLREDYVHLLKVISGDDLPKTIEESLWNLFITLGDVNPSMMGMLGAPMLRRW